MVEESIADKKLSRRQFVGTAAAGAAALSAGAILSPKLPSASPAAPASPKASEAAVLDQPTADQPYGTPSSWDYQADVVIVGAGCAGMCAAITAAQAGASVLVVEENYDIGGKMMMNGGGTYFGGGTSSQIAYKITDSPDLFFSDLTSPLATYSSATSNSYVPTPYAWNSTLTTTSGPMLGSKYVPRDLYRVMADESVPTWDWLLANGVQFNTTAIANTPPSSGPTNWASGTPRSQTCYWNGGPPFTASAMAPGGAPGTGFARPLEIAARAAGVQFLLNWRMTSVIRESPYSGDVLGVTASATGGRFMPGNPTPLQPYMAGPGNLTLGVSTAYIKASRAVIVCTGGSSSNVYRRREIDPRLTGVYTCVGDPYSFQTGDGEYAARRIGASLWGAANEVAEMDSELTNVSRIGAQYGGLAYVMGTGSPVFPLFRAIGLTVANYDGIIHVNMAGVRFVAENALRYVWLDAALAINAASTPPDYAAGPIWAIFDSATVARQKWVLGYPNTDPLFFFQANDLPTLAAQMNTNSFQTTPMDGPTLQNAVNRYNSFVTAGKGDPDFGKPASLMNYQINTPPYYAAWTTPVVRDWYAGVHINTSSQALDLNGSVIPHFYVAGEDANVGCFHGMQKCMVFGRIAGRNAASETPL